MTPRIAVIGAGLAGVTAARALARAGADITVFEKSRGLGGRMSTRRAAPWAFDHGAQYFTARDPAFRALIAEAVAAHVVAPWNAHFVVIRSDGARVPDRDGTRYVGVPSMNALVKWCARDLDVRRGVRVATLDRDGGAWGLTAEDGRDLGHFDAVLLSTPAEQAAVLCAGVAPLSAEIRGAYTAPCWAVMVAFERSLGAPFDAVTSGESAIAWAARDGSKPGRATGDGECWVLHASAEWTTANLELERAEVLARLVPELGVLTGAALPPTSYAAAHLWRYARTVATLEAPCLWDADLRIGACGDWCVGPRVEAAFLSGRALAERVEQSVPMR